MQQKRGNGRAIKNIFAMWQGACNGKGVEWKQ
jgi:hypothetical protein